MSSKHKPTTIEVTYHGDARNKTTHHIKKHMDIFADDIGIGKVYDIVISDGKLPIILESGEHKMVSTSTLRPLAALMEYDMKRLLNMIANKRELQRLGLETPKKPPPRKSGNTGVKRPSRHVIPTERVLRRRSLDNSGEESAAGAQAAADHAEIPEAGAAGDAQAAADDVAGDGAAGGEAAGDDDMAGEIPEAGAAGDAQAAADDVAGDGAAGGEAAGDDDMAGDAPSGADKSGEAKVQMLFTKLIDRFERQEKQGERIEKKLDAILRGGVDGGKQAKTNSAKGTKEERREMGFDWDKFEPQADDDGDAMPLISKAVAHVMLQPFIEPMAQLVSEWFHRHLGPKMMQMPLKDSMRIMYLAVEDGDQPSEDMVQELAYGGKFLNLCKATNAIVHDLKNRFFKSILIKFNQAKVADAIEKGSLHDKDTLFQSPWVVDGEAGTVFFAYGESNRKKGDFSIPATNQHLPAWSVTTTSKNLITGLVTNLPYLGSNILENYVEKTTFDGEMPPLDALSVFVAYAMAKEFDININHGFNLKLAAQEWKTWVLNNETRKKGTIVTIVKKYLEEKKAEREARGAARGAA